MWTTSHHTSAHMLASFNQWDNEHVSEIHVGALVTAGISYSYLPEETLAAKKFIAVSSLQAVIFLSFFYFNIFYVFNIFHIVPVIINRLKSTPLFIMRSFSKVWEISSFKYCCACLILSNYQQVRLYMMLISKLYWI